ncbi:cytochrome c-type biogenesis protein CcsB [Knoellia remsis]|uniref:Cytochrome c-type biogenesis protein CcsB n=1 Tax=Knoellia remsis TaxID=407159 RepID=A0A2T0UN65_9MICO|nr:c-type cytochrome biogenesis protein CcsB [Knoellia remsis]PRY59336.1 cytochrome c-type biogenesis protein CcsB [Knoellia remsis]
MTNETLAGYSNLALYSAMVVLTLSMVLYAVYLAGLLPARESARESAAEAEVTERELVGVGAGAGASERAGRGVEAGPPAPVELSARTRKAGGIAQSFAVLGTLLLVATAVLRGLSVHRWPLGNMYEFGVVASMFTMVVFVVWALRRDVKWLGLFVVGPVLVVLGMALTVWYTEASQLMPSLQSIWLAIHVTVATISVALFAVGCSVGLLYLAQRRFGRSRGVLAVLPEPRVLERLTYGLHIIAFPLWTFTLIAGAIWARQAWGAYWNWDPKEVWTFVIWVVYAAYLHARVTRGWSRESATWIAVAGFICVILNYAVVNVYFVGMHSYSGL